jgi:hypothetical protein
MRKVIILLAAIVAMSAPGATTAQTQAPVVEHYQWSGELVSFEDGTKTVTIKARLVNQEGVADLKRFKAGDRVNLLWSGFDKYADGIRRVMAYPADRKGDERFLLPAELVSTEAPNQYVTFRLRVPDSQTAALKPVKPGEWVTVTSPHRASRDADAVVSIRPYVIPGASTD